MHSAILESLTSDGPFCNSLQIMIRANTRYHRMIDWIDQELGIGCPQSKVGLGLGSLSADERNFLLRCGTVRVLADRLSALLHSADKNTRRDALLEAYHALQQPFQAVEKARLIDQARDWRNTWSAAHFDCRRLLSECFPFLMSAWVGIEKQDDQPNNWNEARDVEELFRKEIPTAGAEECCLRPLTEAQCSLIEQAVEAIQALCVHTAYDILINVRHVCYIDYSRWPHMTDAEYRDIAQSLSRNNVPSCIFLSCHAFASIDDLAESIYHEALHRKLSNLIHARQILRPGYHWKESPRFRCQWNRHFSWGSHEWPFDRALDAYHVYVHLYVYYGAVLELMPDQFSLDRAARRREVAHARAMSLGEWLYKNASECMDTDGLPFLETMKQAVALSSNQMSV